MKRLSEKAELFAVLSGRQVDGENKETWVRPWVKVRVHS